MASDHAAWLASTTEDALEPELPICDPHHHLWDHPKSRYLLDELLADTGSGHNVVSTVFVECMSEYRDAGPEALRPVGETDFVESIATAAEGATSNRVAAGIVSYADLTLGKGAREVLEAHIAASPRFRGIRHAAAWDASDAVRNSHTDPPRGLYLDPAFREGFACLVDLDLCFDVWIYHPQLEEVADLARAFPAARIVLDHVGGPLGIGPYEREAVTNAWREGVRTVAECPNVHVKLGGLTMPVCGFGFHKRAAPPSSETLAEETGPYYRFCIEQFGAERCMFESNFPVDKASCSYGILWNAFKRVSRDLPGADRAALFHDTAARFYRLDESTRTS